MPRHRRQLDEYGKAWVRKYAAANLWRVGNCYDFADLVQDGFLCAAIVADRYTTKNMRHYMALVMRVFSNHIGQLAKRRTRERALTDSLEYIATLPGSRTCSAAETDRWLAEQEPDIRDAIIALDQCNKRDMSEPARKYKNGTIETTEKRLLRLTKHVPDRRHRRYVDGTIEPTRDMLSRTNLAHRLHDALTD